MHQPPAVSIAARKARSHALVLLLLSLLSLCSVAFFVASTAQPWLSWGLVALCLAALVLAWRGWSAAPCGRLHWNGVAWVWSNAQASVPCTLSLQWDMQFFMVVAMQPLGSPASVLWLEPCQGSMHWRAVRRAVCGAVMPQPAHS